MLSFPRAHDSLLDGLRCSDINRRTCKRQNLALYTIGIEVQVVLFISRRIGIQER